MKIGIDISISKINQAGTATYTTNLLQALQALDTENDYQIFSISYEHDMSKQKSLRTRLNTLYRDIIWTHGILPWQVARAQVDLLHMPANVIPVVSSCKTVVSILDGIIFQSPEKFPFWHRNYSRLLIPFSARRAARILTISEQSKRDLVKYLRVHPDKIVVTYLASAPEFRMIANSETERIRQTYDLDKFIFTVGTLEPRKNMIRVLQAFAQLRAKGFPGFLVHAGPKGWLYEDILAEVNRLHLQEVVRFLGRVSTQNLVGLYNAASLFVYPSLYEGFGIPVVEAMACGCPVITSNLSSLPEVNGEAGIMVDPYNTTQLAEAMQQVLADPALAQCMKERGLERARLFSWERCAHTTMAVYQQVLAT